MGKVRMTEHYGDAYVQESYDYIYAYTYCDSCGSFDVGFSSTLPALVGQMLVVTMLVSYFAGLGIVALFTSKWYLGCLMGLISLIAFVVIGSTGHLKCSRCGNELITSDNVLDYVPNDRSVIDVPSGSIHKRRIKIVESRSGRRSAGRARSAARVGEVRDMPKLDWDETDFVECLECIPRHREGVRVFEKDIDGLQLVVEVWEHKSFLRISLRRNKHCLISNAIFVRGSVELRKEEFSQYLAPKTGHPEFLLLRNCVIAPGRSSCSEVGDPLDIKEYPAGCDVRIAIKPDISIEYHT